MSMKAMNAYKPGESDTRPWGTWTVLEVGDGYAIKEIVVNPGEVLSLQSHEHRAEHWIVVQGLAEVTVADSVFRCGVNETAFIPTQAKHRIANVGEEPMRFIEVQTGSVLVEDDIQRYDDRYGRTS